MTLKQKIVIALSIILGTVTSILGLWLLFDYFNELSVSLRSVDKSFVFWGLVPLFISLGILALGGSMFTIGMKSQRNIKLYTTSKILLLTWLVVAIGVTVLFVSDELVTKQSREQSLETEHIIANSHKINAVNIINHDANGFEINIEFSDGAPNSYTLTTDVIVDRTQFFSVSESLHLDSGKENAKKRFSYNDIFRNCWTDATLTKAYVCINNASVDANVEIRATLTLDNNVVSPQRLAAERNAASAEFTIVTATANNVVAVSNFSLKK